MNKSKIKSNPVCDMCYHNGRFPKMGCTMKKICKEPAVPIKVKKVIKKEVKKK